MFNFKVLLPSADGAMAVAQPEKVDNTPQPFIGPLPASELATARALCVTEILEKVLHEVGVLDLKTLLLSQRVSQRFHDTIANSITLQRDLFFELDPPKEEISYQPGPAPMPFNIFVRGTSDPSLNAPRLNPFLHHEGDVDVVVLRAATCGNNACFHVGSHWDLPEDPNAPARTAWFLHIKAGWISPLNSSDKADADKHASWRKMWTSDPPTRIHHLDAALGGTEAERLLGMKMGPLLGELKTFSTTQREQHGELVRHYEHVASRRMKILKARAAPPLIKTPAARVPPPLVETPEARVVETVEVKTVSQPSRFALTFAILWALFWFFINPLLWDPQSYRNIQAIKERDRELARRREVERMQKALEKEREDERKAARQREEDRKEEHRKARWDAWIAASNEEAKSFRPLTRRQRHVHAFKRCIENGYHGVEALSKVRASADGQHPQRMRFEFRRSDFDPAPETFDIWI